jgi:radical SAM superfamily enzyme YgiQ (UPF0313 family)
LKALLVTMAGAPATPSCFMPDNGLAGLAAVLIDAGHEVEILDLNTPATMDRLFPVELRRAIRPHLLRRLSGEPAPPHALEALADIERRLDAHRDAEYAQIGREVAARTATAGARLVGFKLWNGDGFTGSAHLARAVQALGGITVVGGGSQVDFFGEALFSDEGSDGYDALVVAEGEPAVLGLAEVVEGKRRLDEVPNLILRGSPPRRTGLSRIASLDGLPPPAYAEEVYPRAGQLRVATYEETRGCPFRCAFCNHPLKAGHEMRARSPAGAVEDMLALVRRYGFRGFKLGGSYTPSAYMRDLAAVMVARGARLPFSCYGRISDAREADFTLYRDAGCEALFFGVESGSQLLLNRKIHKGYRVPDGERVLRAARSAGIFTIASLIYPNPGETDESRRATLRFVEAVEPDGAPVHFPVLLPGSAWFAEPGRYGFTVDDPAAYVKRAIRYKARLLFPPSFWPELPYRIDGKPFAVFAAETEEFTRDVERLGVVTLISDEAALLARLLGEPPRAFRDRIRLALASGDVDAVSGMIDAVNRAPSPVELGAAAV